MQFGDEKTRYCEHIYSSYSRSNITHSIEKSRETTKKSLNYGGAEKSQMHYGAFFQFPNPLVKFQKKGSKSSKIVYTAFCLQKML